MRWKMFTKWHLLMPLVAGLYGYFPGNGLQSLETTAFLP